MNHTMAKAVHGHREWPREWSAWSKPSRMSHVGPPGLLPASVLPGPSPAPLP